MSRTWEVRGSRAKDTRGLASRRWCQQTVRGHSCIHACWPLSWAAGLRGVIARWVVLRSVWFIDLHTPEGPVRLYSARWWRRLFPPLRETRSRLDAGLERMILEANYCERLRRAANVTNWVLMGLVSTRQRAQSVASYEVRSSSPAWLTRPWVHRCAITDSARM